MCIHICHVQDAEEKELRGYLSHPYTIYICHNQHACTYVIHNNCVYIIRKTRVCTCHTQYSCTYMSYAILLYMSYT